MVGFRSDKISSNNGTMRHSNTSFRVRISRKINGVLSKMKSYCKRNVTAKRLSLHASKKRNSISYNIEKENWGRLREILSEPSLQEHDRRALYKTDFLGKNYIHQLCRVHPPLDIIQSIIAACPDLVSSPDIANRFPLHYAVGWGASPQVVKIILEKEQDIALWGDLDGKTPLHMAFDGCGDGICDTGNGELIQGPLAAVVLSLCEVAPAAVNKEDNRGTTPLEYAIQNAANTRLIRTLQKLSVESWKTQRAVNLSLVALDDQDNISDKNLPTEINFTNIINQDTIGIENRHSYVLMMEEREKRKEIPIMIDIPTSSESDWDSRVSFLSC